MFGIRSFWGILLALMLAAGSLLLDFSYAGSEFEKEASRKAIDAAAEFLISNVKQPGPGSVSGEWTVLGLSLSGYPLSKQYKDAYAEKVSNYLKSNDGILSVNKYSEYSRVILAYTGLGLDVTDVGGYNLLNYLADYNHVVKQGINGPVYALIALDSVGYDIPNIAGNQATRQNLLNYIMSRELVAGGFALAGTVPDPDITGMVLSALAGYTDRQDVMEVIERALPVLSTVKLNSSESIAQVILGLTSVGIDPEKDPRFSRIGSDGKIHGLVSELLAYQENGGGFRHVKDGKADLMSTEQALLALLAQSRLSEGEQRLFDMSDEKGPGALYRYKVKIFDRYLAFDQPPINENKRILVPLRAIFEYLGVSVGWDQDLMQVTGTKGDREIVLVIGSKIACVNGSPIALDVPATILNGRTLVPVRFIAESLDADVGWDSSENTVEIKY